jgi:hypothetical protein
MIEETAGLQDEHPCHEAGDTPVYTSASEKLLLGSS